MTLLVVGSCSGVPEVRNYEGGIDAIHGTLSLRGDGSFVLSMRTPEELGSGPCTLFFADGTWQRVPPVDAGDALGHTGTERGLQLEVRNSVRFDGEQPDKPGLTHTQGLPWVDTGTLWSASFVGNDLRVSGIWPPFVMRRK